MVLVAGGWICVAVVSQETDRTSGTSGFQFHFALVCVPTLPQSSTCSTALKTSFHWEGSSRKCLSTPCFSNTQNERSTTSYTDVISEDNTAVSVVHWIIKGKSLVNNFTYHSVTECKSVFKKGNKNKSLSGLTLFYYWEERLSRKAPWSLMFDKIRLI